MTGSLRIASLWVAAIVAVGLMANLPRDSGAVKKFTQEAGFPVTFARWTDGRLDWFSTRNLLLDSFVWISLGVSVGCVIGYQYCKRNRRTQPRSGDLR